MTSRRLQLVPISSIAAVLTAVAALAAAVEGSSAYQWPGGVSGMELGLLIVWQLAQDGADVSWLSVINALVTLLVGGGLLGLTQYAVARLRIANARSEAAKTDAEAARTKVDVVEARFQISKKEWDFATQRLEWLMKRNAELEARVATLQQTIDSDRETNRTRISNLEDQVFARDNALEAYEFYLKRLEGSIRVEPHASQLRIFDRLKKLKRPLWPAEQVQEPKAESQKPKADT